MNKFVGKCKTFIIKNEPAILAGVGTTLLVAATVDGIRATISAKNAVDAYNKDHKKHPLTKKEIVKIVWKKYIPTAIMVGGGITCVVGSQKVSSKRLTAMSTVAATAAAELKEFKKKSVEVLGAEASKKVNNAVLQDKVATNAVPAEVESTKEAGDMLFVEPTTGQYFYSTWPKVTDAMARTNLDGSKGAFSNGWMCLNNLLDNLGCYRVPAGDTLGWDLNRGHTVDYEKDAKGKPFKVEAYTPEGYACNSWEYTYAPTDKEF